MDFSLFLFLALAGIVAWWIVRERSLRSAVDELRLQQELMRNDLTRLRRQVESTSATQTPTSQAQHQQPALEAPPSTPPPIPLATLYGMEAVASVPTQPMPPPLPTFHAVPEAQSPDSEETVPAVVLEPEPAPKPAFNWEQFVGVKLFAWLGGLALFFAAALGLKYSFDHDLIPPAMRAAAGFVLGGGLVVAGVVMRRREYAVTAQTLTATGVVILYAVTFACRSLFHFEAFGPVLTFGVMALITTVAFVLAARMDAQVVAVLGMLGGFLTPRLVATGEDNPLGLFGYLAILDLGLLAVVHRKRWDYLALLAALGTVAWELAWFVKFYTPAKFAVAQAVLLGFSALFIAAFAWAARRDWLNQFLTAAAAGLPLFALGVCFDFVTSRELAAQPGRLFLVVFGADLCMLALVTLRPSLRLLETIGGGAVFLLLSLWTSFRLTAELVPWSLGLTLGFAAMHTAFPLLLKRLRPADSAPAPVWSQFFPALALLVTLIPIMKSLPTGLLFWAVVLLVDVLAVSLALMAGALLGLIAVVVLTFALAGVWLGARPHELADLGESLFVIGGFSVFLFAAGAFVARRLAVKSDDRLPAAVPMLSASLPFLLLVMVVARFKPANPSAIFGVAALLSVMLLGLVRVTRFDPLAAVGLGAVALLQFAWQSTAFRPEAPTIPLLWHLGFWAMFTGFPFLFLRTFAERRLPWAVAALAGVVHFGLVHPLVKQAFPAVPPGLVPAVFALPALAGLAVLVKRLPVETPHRLDHLAWFGGVALFFITLIFPVQFDREWITLGWALEGVALCWLFHRLPHPGLRLTGVGLLIAAFVRLALNPAVLGYHERTGTPILNWFLYTYGLVTVCLFVAARLLAPPRERVLGVNVIPLLCTLGTVLAFLLVNLEIADYFATGSTLTFEFSGSFARDLTYTIAWALFALGLIVIGVAKQVRAVRYAGLALLGVVAVKLFFHDLARLSQLYRIISFAAVAVIALLASFLYQRFLAGRVSMSEKSRQE